VTFRTARTYALEELEGLLSLAVGHGLSPALRAHAVRTRWSVVTGTYSAGKTTLVRDLAASLDMRATKEPARAFIEAYLAKEGSAESLWARPAATVQPIHEERVRYEMSLDPASRVLLDTAIPDTLAYALLYKAAVSEIVAACGRFSYSEPILFLDPLPLVIDEIRNDDASERFAIHYLRSRIYSLLGYSEFTIPALDPRERLKYATKALRYQRIPKT
jgi:predicted ATPase